MNNPYKIKLNFQVDYFFEMQKKLPKKNVNEPKSQV